MRDFVVKYRGVNANEIARDASNLMVRSMHKAAEAMHASLPSAELEVQNDIPLGVGLGSSAAAILAGILLGGKLSGGELSSAEVLQLATEIEGHPDNVAAALHGGFVLAATPEDDASILVAKAIVSQALDFIAVIPDVPLPTEKARSVLPAQYSRRDVVANLQRTALLAARFFTGGELSPEFFADRLHQPYRAPLVPGIAECLAFRHPGLAGIFLSGAGSAVMAIVRHSPREITEALIAEFQRKGTGARALSLRADNSGAKIFSGDLRAAEAAASQPKVQS
jgi:homoserine kinase